jgi:soluble lytic murein transglycosylase-like protein
MKNFENIATIIIMILCTIAVIIGSTTFFILRSTIKTNATIIIENEALKNRIKISKKIIESKTKKILLLKKEAAERTRASKRYKNKNKRGSLSSRGSFDRSKYRELISKHFGNNSSTAYAILLQESGGNPEAVQSRTGCYGLFQIRLSSHWKKIPGNTREEKIKNLKNPEINTKLAVEISGKGKNWHPWEAYTSGRYRKYK